MNIRKYKTFLVVQIVCLLCFSPALLSQGYGVKKIVIDAGHGGKDPGAVGHKVKEKDIVLKVALLAGEYIEKYLDDVEVVYTRTNDTYVELNERASFANKAKADLFISIHANSVGNNSSAYGAETFILGNEKGENNLKIAQKENSVITFEDNFEEKYEGFNPNSPESYIIFNFMQSAYQEQSMILAALVQHQYTKQVGRKDREVRQAPFWVLAATSMPAILTELGFLSNANEEKFLMSDEGQDYMASAIFRAVRDYKKEIEAKQSLSLTDAELQLQKQDIPLRESTVSPITSSGPTHSGVTYKLQIFSSSKILKFDHRSIKDLKDVDYYVEGNMYKYTLGYSADLEDIKKIKNKYKDVYAGCFIVAFQNGKHISMAEAKAILDGQ